jgi:endonuclease/exonuclease/phosphatase family metal-dependent hydrolase
MTTFSWWSRISSVPRALLLLVLLVMLAALGIAPAPAPAQAVPKTTSSVAGRDPLSLRVGSFNVRCANCYEGIGAEMKWPQRRSAVVATIRSENLDVLGVQEASQGLLKNSNGKRTKTNQYESLMQGLGSPWKMVNAKRYNCVDSTTERKCRYKNQGASLWTRILYNSDRIAVMDSGSKLLPETDEKGTRHYMAWARLQQLSTGLEFMFSDSHLTAYAENDQLRITQARVALAELQKHNTDQLAMIAVGDWNSGRYNVPSNGPYEVYLAAGFVDPLGARGPGGSNPAKAPVEKRINTWVDSWNGWSRRPGGNRSSLNGTYLDYILTTPMRVSEWETVVNLDANGNFIGRIPSDHNMIRATVYLPEPTN